MKQTSNRLVARGSAESAQRQIEFGQQLAIEKQHCVAQGRRWSEHIRDTFGISREWADELIRIGTGVTTVEESRRKKKKSQRAARGRNTLNKTVKTQFLNCVDLSVRKCNYAKSLVNNKKMSAEDLADMRDSISNAIFSWQQFFDILK